MKKIFLCVFTISLFANSFSQKVDHRKPATLGVSFFLNDFQTAADIKKTSLGNVLRAKTFFKTSRMNPGIALNYLKGLSNNIDFAGTLGGSFVDYPFTNLPRSSNKNFLVEATANLNLKLLSDNYWFVPFVDLGIGASKYQQHYAAFAPIGLGVQVSLFEEAFLILNSQYRTSITEDASSHFYHSITLAGLIGRKREAPVKVVELPVIEAPKDRDGDGIVDSLDACPDQAGPASLNGCPDRDNDGIADKDDSCPDVAGLAKYHGCPIPDTDKDGINDEEDKCPNEAGPASNFGCPVIKQEIVEKVNLAAKNIFFATGSAKLLAKSYPSLNNVVQILKDNPTFKVDIEGHTDTTGTAEKNHVLSHNRADAVKAYLISKGVDESRLATEGYGSDRPIASNKTAAGKAKNRRVEMKLKNY